MDNTSGKYTLEGDAVLDKNREDDLRDDDYDEDETRAEAGTSLPLALPPRLVAEVQNLETRRKAVDAERKAVDAELAVAHTELWANIHNEYPDLAADENFTLDVEYLPQDIVMLKRPCPSCCESDDDGDNPISSMLKAMLDRNK